MRVRKEEPSNDNELHSLTTYRLVHEETKSPKSKYNVSFERKIERLWFQSNPLGWGYSDFVVHLLEVLVVLRHRDGVKRAAALEELPNR
jgi:hypothetical protein